MKIIILLLFAFVTIAPYVAKGDAFDAQCTGTWADGAKLLFRDGNVNTPTVIISPNGIFSISGSIKGVSLIGLGRSSRLDVFVNPPLMEVLWAPDSRKFVINVSDGGLVGTWESYIYSIDDRGIPVSKDIQSLIMPISNKILQCEPGEVVNTGIAAWLNDSKEVLLIAEVPPHSSCRNMGAITGFRISIETMELIERISEPELRKNWRRVLGCRFTVKSLEQSN